MIQGYKRNAAIMRSGATSGDELGRLLAAAEGNKADATAVGNARNHHLKALLGEHSHSASSDLRHELTNVAFALARDERRLTSNSGAYHEFGSPVPTRALISLQKIVERAGYPYSIVTQGNIRVKDPQGDILAAVSAVAGTPSALSPSFFSLSGKELEEAMPVLDSLKDRGVSVELWPALVLTEIKVPSVDSMAV